MKIQAQNLEKGMTIKYGKEKKRIKELLYINGMVQLTVENPAKKKRHVNQCMNVCMDFEFQLVTETNTIQGVTVK